MDKAVEGYLALAATLIPTGISLLTSDVTPDGYGKQIVGGIMFLGGLYALKLRADVKTKNITGYVKKKVSQVRAKDEASEEV